MQPGREGVEERFVPKAARPARHGQVLYLGQPGGEDKERFVPKASR